MSTRVSVDLMCIMPPLFVGINDTSAIRIAIDTTIVLADLFYYIIDPLGNTQDITANFVSAASAPFGNYWMVAPYSFRLPGLYTFYVYSSGAISGITGGWVASTYCAEWSSKLDVPVSRMGRQRSDIQRIFGRVNNKGE